MRSYSLSLFLSRQDRSSFLSPSGYYKITTCFEALHPFYDDDLMYNKPETVAFPWTATFSPRSKPKEHEVMSYLCQNLNFIVYLLLPFSLT